MNELQRLEAALRAAHDAGDVAAAQRFAQAIRELQASGQPTGISRTWEVDPRVSGRKAAEEAGAVRGPVSAAIQGAGSMAFGIGTPITAAGEFIGSRIRGEPRSLEESLEFARGFREGSYEENPGAYRTGAVAGLVGSGSAVRETVKRLPVAARSVFTLQSGQTARNIARMSGAGAAAAGVTAGAQEGSEAVLPAAGLGAVAGPVTAGVLRAGTGTARWVGSKIDPSNAAIRILAKRLGEAPSAIAARYNDFVRVMGRKPRLLEIMRGETAEEMGQISASKVGVGAGRVFTEAEEAASLTRPGELSDLVRGGRRTTTVPEQQAEFVPITEETRRAVGARVHPASTQAAHEARRNRIMDVAMGRIGNHRVPLTDEMREVIEDPDVQSALPGALRRRIVKALDQGETIGSIDLSVRTWEMMRQALAGKSGAGAGQIYSRLRDKVRDYVTERVPEYGRAVSEFGRRSAAAEKITEARGAIQKSTLEFTDVLRDNTLSERAGARRGVRAWFANQLGGTPQQASRVMDRLARDNRFRNNLRAALSDREVQQLEALAEQYGHRLDIIGGVKVGQKVIKAGDAATFDDAVRTANTTRGGEIGVRTGARGSLAEKAGESPGAAIAVAESMAEHPGLQQRIASALGGPEAARLQRVGTTTTQAARNMIVATPRRTEAQSRAAAEAQKVQEVITGVVALSGRASGALLANLGNNVQKRFHFSEKVAKRLAEMAVDPDNAAAFIYRMRQAGATQDEIMRWYQDAAVAAGIVVGAQ